MKTRNLVAGLVDLVSAAFFLTLWIAPLALGPAGIRAAFLLVLVEFLLMHAAGVLGAQQGRGPVGCLAWLCSAVAILAFFVVAAVSFEARWPLLALAWLLVGKMPARAPIGQDAILVRYRSNGIWMISFLTWLVLVPLLFVFPVPSLGLQPDVVARIDVGVSGILAERPQKLMAFGAIYFLLLAAVKLTGFNVLDALSSRAETD